LSYGFLPKPASFSMPFGKALFSKPSDNTEEAFSRLDAIFEQRLLVLTSSKHRQQ
jgi:hypothetical protein